MLSMLHAGPCRGAASLLLREASEHGLLPSLQPGVNGQPAEPYPFAELQLRHPCPPGQLRGLLRRVPRRGTGQAGTTSLLSLQVAQAIDSKKAATDSHLPLLFEQLRQREVRGSSRPSGTRGSSLQQLRPRCAAELLLGKERFGLRGFVEGHFNTAFCVGFDATGERVFTGGDDCLIKVWNTRTCFALRTLKGVPCTHESV